MRWLEGRLKVPGRRRPPTEYCDCGKELIAYPPDAEFGITFYWCPEHGWMPWVLYSR